MPVVATREIKPGVYEFPVIFTPNVAADWTWWIETEMPLGGAVIELPAGAPTASSPGEIVSVASNLRGWPRPDIASGKSIDPPGTYPWALVEPQGGGTFSYWRPAQSTYFTMANMGFSFSHTTSAINFMAAAKINRARIALTCVSARTSANLASSGGAANHTVFAKLPATTDFQFANIDFSRFDLDQWAYIDTLVGTLGANGINASIILMFNTGEQDYEEHYIYDRAQNMVAPSPAPTRWADGQDWYLWYVVGRLAAYTNVEWCLGHEWDAGPTGSSNRSPYSASVVSSFGLKLGMIEPYLSYEPNCKIVTTLPGRNTFYSVEMTVFPGQMAPAPSFAQLGFSHSSNVPNESAFLTTADDDWRSCIGLQRGGELGITSIVPMYGTTGDSLRSAQMGYPTVTSPAIRSEITSPTTQANPTANRPILIEEDWLTKNIVPDPNANPGQTNPAGNFATADNPYAKYLRWHSTQAGTWIVNPNAFTFIDNNYDGLRKSHRDSAWMAGVVCQAYTAHWTRKYNYMSNPHTSISWMPYAAIWKLWTHELEWWRFTYDQELVVDQSILEPLAGTAAVFYGAFGDWTTAYDQAVAPRLRRNNTSTIPGRPPFEQLAIGCKSNHGGSATQYVAYCPVGVSELPSTCSISVNLDELGAGTYDYYYANPDTGKKSASPLTMVLAGGASNASVSFAAPAEDLQGEHGEYVLFINCPF